MQILKKIFSSATAAAMSVSAMTLSAFAAETAPELPALPVTYEFEELDIGSNDIWTSVYDNQLPGYSGDGFIYLTGDPVTLKFTVPEDGMYELSVRYAQILDQDGRDQFMTVNGAQRKFRLPYRNKWDDYNIGKIRFKAGVNTIQFLSQSGGYAEYDTITISNAQYPELNIEPALSDANATKETQSLMNYLCDVYGKNMLSGQQEIYGNGHTENEPGGYSGEELLGYESEFEWIKKNFGDYPAIRGFDYMNYNSIYGWDDNTTERIIEWANERNGIPTVCQHLNIPDDFDSYEIGDKVNWDQASYEVNKSFSVVNATTPGTKEYEYLMENIEILANELLKLQDEGIPVIFRPYHEAEGNPNNPWFWWGQDGPEAYKALWRQLHTTLTDKYGVHNLIWQFNSYTYDTSPEWYPGDEWVDIVGFDKYNCVFNRTDGLSNCPNEDAISDTFYKLVDLTNNKKLVAMPENDTVPSLENIFTEKAYWLYFCIWYDSNDEKFLTGSNKNNYDTLKATYQSDYCITLSELPDWRNYGEAVDKFIPGDVNDDKKVNVYDSILLKRLLIDDLSKDVIPESIYLAQGDVDADNELTVADLMLLNEYLLGMDVKLKQPAVSDE